MWIVFLTLCGFLFRSSAAREIEEKCYGERLTFPFNYVPWFYKGPLYFTPSNGGPQRLMMDNGEAKDPRLYVKRSSMYIQDLRVEDEGYFSKSTDGSQESRILTLKVLDCADEERRYYGGTFTYRVSYEAEFLEFTPLRSSDQLTILWNRSDSSVSPKGPDISVKILDGTVYWERRFLTPKHNGYYNFRRKDNSLISRFHLKVEENEDSLIEKAGKHLRIKYPWTRVDWTVNFRPESDPEYSITFKRNQGQSGSWFEDRIQVDSDGIDIYPLKSTDAGIFQFQDGEGNLVSVVHLKVEDDLPGIKYVAIAAVVMLAVVTCCCCYCCKKRRKKREMATPVLLNHTTSSPAAPPAVHYRGRSQPPAYTTVSAPPASTPQTVNSYASIGATDASREPPVYNPVSVHLNPTQPEMSVPAPPISSGFLTSDAELRFELKGMTSASSLPLSSESHVCDVYNSDKLNFL